jgi:hypothetical protein
LISRLRQRGTDGDIVKDIDHGGGPVGMWARDNVAGVPIAQANVPKWVKGIDLAKLQTLGGGGFPGQRK